MTHPTVLWEITRAIGCAQCPAPADNSRRPEEELSTYEAYKTIDQIASLAPKQFIITGADPLARPDLLQVLDYARRRGLQPAVSLTTTANVTQQAIDRLRRSGALTLIFALHASSATRHDLLSGILGSFDRTLLAIRAAVNAGMSVEIDTLITRRNAGDLTALANLLAGLGVVAWNAHFIVPIGNTRPAEILTAEEAERVFEVLAAVQRDNRFQIRTVEAPEYRRHLLQARTDPSWADFANDYPDEIADCSIDDVVFISASGSVRPSEMLPIAAGNIRFRPLFGIVRGSDLFVALRDRGNLTGKCARCEYKQACGGSRARAWAMTGLLFGPDPLCAYQPPRPPKEASS